MMGPLSLLIGIITAIVIIGAVGYAITKFTSGPENTEGVTSDMNNMNSDTSDMNNMNMNGDISTDDLRGDYPNSDIYSNTSNNNMDSFNKNY